MGDETLTLDAAPGPDPENRTIGPYRLLEKLGEGGMGEVWLAEQREPVRREVALKLVRTDLDRADVLARFASEGQALALMEHPGIARIFDVGTADAGRPYFAMELVRGRPITEYCDAKRLNIEERIELFSQVCAAVQHAHQKAILHRDLKPSNILVVEHEGRPTVKVIDFGIAKAMSVSLTEETLHTRLGQIVGTPAYMSPEQADPFHTLLDTRTDVYSLGVILYELLTGELPFPVEDDSGAGALSRKLRETPVPRPSTRARTTVTDRAVARRCADSRQLARKLRGELDWIVLRAIEHEPDRRYPSPLELGRDLERSLRNEPVEAGPPGVWYRARKFSERHRWAVAGAIGLLLALLLGGSLAAVGLVRAQRAEAEARRHAETAEEVAGFLQGLFRGADPRQHRGADVSARQLLDQGLADLDGQLEDRPAVKAAILHSMAEVYRELGELERAEGMLREAIALREAAPADEDLDLARTVVELGDLLRQRDRFDEALEWFGRAESLLGPVDGDSAGVHAKYWNDLGLVLHGLARYDEAEAAQRRSLELREAHYGIPSAEVATGLHNLAMTLSEEDPQAGVEMERRVLSMRREVFGGDHPRVASSLNALGSMLLDLGRWDEAEGHLEESLAMRRRLGVEDQRVANSLGELAWARFRRRDYTAAEATYREALDLAERSVGRASRTFAYSLSELGLLLRETARFDEAEAIFRESVEIRREIFGPSHPAVHNAERYLGSLLTLRGELEEAKRWLDAAVDGYREAVGPEHSSTIGAEIERARWLLASGDSEEARETARVLIGRVEAGGFTGTVLRPRALAILGEAQRAMGEAASAVETLEEAVEAFAAGSDRYLLERARTEARLGFALEELGRRAEARRALEASRRSFAEVTAPHPLAAEVERRLTGLEAEARVG